MAFLSGQLVNDPSATVCQAKLQGTELLIRRCHDDGFQAISARFNGSSPKGFWNIQTAISGGIKGTYYYYI